MASGAPSRDIYPSERSSRSDSSVSNHGNDPRVFASVNSNYSTSNPAISQYHGGYPTSHLSQQPKTQPLQKRGALFRLLPPSLDSSDLGEPPADSIMTDTEEESSDSPNSSRSSLSSSQNSLGGDADYTDDHEEQSDTDTGPGILDVSQPPALPRFSVLKTTASSSIKLPNALDQSSVAHRGKSPQKGKRRGVTFNTNLVRERYFYAREPAAKCSVHAGEPGAPPPETYLGVPIELNDTVYTPPIQIHITRTSSQLNRSQVITSSLLHAESPKGSGRVPDDNNNSGWEPWCQPDLIEVPVSPCYRHLLKRKVARHQELLRNLSNSGTDLTASSSSQPAKATAELTPEEQALQLFIQKLEPLRSSYHGGGIAAGSIGIGAYRLLKSVHKSHQKLHNQAEKDDVIVLPDLSPLTWTSTLNAACLKQFLNLKEQTPASVDDPQNKAVLAANGGTMSLSYFPHLLRNSPLPQTDLELFDSKAGLTTTLPDSLQNIQTSIHYPLSYNNFLLNLHRLPITPSPRGHCVTPCSLLEDHRIAQTASSLALSHGIEFNVASISTVSAHKVVTHTGLAPSTAFLRQHFYQNYDKLTQFMEFLTIPRPMRDIAARYLRHHLNTLVHSQSPLTAILTPPLSSSSSTSSTHSPSSSFSALLAHPIPLDYIPQVISYLKESAPALLPRFQTLGHIYYTDIPRLNATAFTPKLYQTPPQAAFAATSGDNLSPTSCQLQFGLIEFPLAKLLPKTVFDTVTTDGQGSGQDFGPDDLFAHGHDLYDSSNASSFHSSFAEFAGDIMNSTLQPNPSAVGLFDAQQPTPAAEPNARSQDHPQHPVGLDFLLGDDDLDSLLQDDSILSLLGPQKVEASLARNEPPSGTAQGATDPLTTPEMGANAAPAASSSLGGLNSVFDDLPGLSTPSTPKPSTLKQQMSPGPSSSDPGSMSTPFPSTALSRSASGSSLWDDSLMLNAYELPRSRSSFSFGSTRRQSTPGLGPLTPAVSAVTPMSTPSLTPAPSESSQSSSAFPTLDEMFARTTSLPSTTPPPPPPAIPAVLASQQHTKRPRPQPAIHGVQMSSTSDPVEQTIKKPRFTPAPPPPPPPL